MEGNKDNETRINVDVSPDENQCCVTEMYVKKLNKRRNNLTKTELRVCVVGLCGYKCITNEVSWAGAQVFSTDGDFGPGCALFGRDARDQRGLTGTRHGGPGRT